MNVSYHVHGAGLGRLPFLIQNRKTYPEKWRLKNRLTTDRGKQQLNLRIQDLLASNEEMIMDTFHDFLAQPGQHKRFGAYLAGPANQIEMRHRLLLKQLMCATRTGDMAVFMNCCRHLAERWYEQGLPLEELRLALEHMGRICLDILRQDPAARSLGHALHDHITLTFQFACDAVHDVNASHDLNLARSPR